MFGSVCGGVVMGEEVTVVVVIVMDGSRVIGGLSCGDDSVVVVTVGVGGVVVAVV